jgi:hypothetical protein
MKIKYFLLPLAAIAIAFVSLPATVLAQSHDDKPAISAKRHYAKKTAVRGTPIGTKIACPKGGCRSIPANCAVTMEMTPDGAPTGNELIDCP